MSPTGSAGNVSQLGMRRQRRSVIAAVRTIKPSVTRIGMGGIMIGSSGQQRGCAIPIEPFPAKGLQRLDQRVVVRQQRVGKSKFVELRAPAWPQLRQPRVLLQKFAAVEIAAAVEEDFSVSVKAINEISAELVGRKDSSAGRQLLHFGCGGYRKLVGRKARTHGDRRQMKRSEQEAGCYGRERDTA